jgi:hypothetical protein
MPTLWKARQDMQVAALDLHEATTGYRPHVETLPYQRAWFEDVLRKELQEPWNAIVATDKPPDKRQVVEHMKTVVQNTAEYAARRTTLYAIDNETEDQGTRAQRRPGGSRSVGYARQINGEYTCPWCIMLASRGPVYTEEEYDKWQADKNAYMHEFHYKCDCILVPVVKAKEKEWSGYREWKRFEEAWGKITKGYSTKDAVNQWRQHFRDAARRGLNPYTMPVESMKERQARLRRREYARAA